MVFTKTYSAPPVNEKEILRYLGGDKSEQTLELIYDCLKELSDKLKYKVCYTELDLLVNNNECDFGVFKLSSKNLAQNLKDAKRVVLFAATVGVEIDRLIAKYGKISPTKALVFQAIGSERAEALCDLFCADMEQTYSLKAIPRFSAGYGDLPLESQKPIFSVLLPERNLGITLTDSMLMFPTKSVTAFVGLK